MHHACLILQLMQVCMTILPMWFLGLHVLIYMFVYTWVMRVWILHVFGYVYTWNNDSHLDRICLDVIQLSMMFSVLIRIPTLVWLLFYESTCIDWLMIARCHLGIHMFVWVNMFTSLSLIAIYLICCVYIIFLWIFFFDKHFPLDIHMFSCHLHRWYCGFIIP